MSALPTLVIAREAVNDESETHSPVPDKTPARRVARAPRAPNGPATIRGRRTNARAPGTPMTSHLRTRTNSGVLSGFASRSPR